MLSSQNKSVGGGDRGAETRKNRGRSKLGGQGACSPENNFEI